VQVGRCAALWLDEDRGLLFTWMPEDTSVHVYHVMDVDTN